MKSLHRHWLAQGALALACVSTMQFSGCIRGAGRDVSSDLREEGTKAAIQASDEIVARKKEAAIAEAESKKKSAPAANVASADSTRSRAAQKSVEAEARKNSLAEFLAQEKPAAKQEDPMLARAGATSKPDESQASGVSQADAEWEALLEVKLAMAREQGRKGALTQAASTGAESAVEQEQGSAGLVSESEKSPESVVSTAGKTIARPFPGSDGADLPRGGVDSMKQPAQPATADAIGFDRAGKGSFHTDLAKTRPHWMSENVAGTESQARLAEMHPEPSPAAGDRLVHSPQNTAAESEKNLAAEWTRVSSLSEGENSADAQTAESELPHRGNAQIVNSLKELAESAGLSPAAQGAGEEPVNRLLPRRDLAQVEATAGTGLSASDAPQIEPQNQMPAINTALVPPKTELDAARLRVQALMSQAHSMMERGELREAYRTALDAQQTAASADIAFSSHDEIPAHLASRIADLLWGPGLRSSQSMVDATTARPADQPLTDVIQNDLKNDPFEASRNSLESNQNPDLFASVFGANQDEPNWRPASDAEFVQNEPVDMRRHHVEPDHQGTARTVDDRMAFMQQEVSSESLTPDPAGPFPLESEPREQAYDPFRPVASKPAERTAKPFRRHNNLGPIQLTHIETETNAVTGQNPGEELALPSLEQSLSEGERGTAVEPAMAPLFAPPVPSELPELPEIARTSGRADSSADKTVLAQQQVEPEEANYGLAWAIVGFCAAALSTVVGLRLHRKRCEECSQAEDSPATLSMTPGREESAGVASAGETSARAA